jgi:hypothetical protein
MTKIDNAASLANRAMLSTLKVRAWSGKASDRDANEGLARANGSDAAMTTVTKALVDPAALKAVQNVAREARALFHENTAVWQDDGTRILLSKNFQAYDQKITRLRGEFTAARDSFLAAYDSEVIAAKNRLGALAKDSDYLSRDDVADKFSFDTHYKPIAEANDWRVNLSEEQIAKLAQDTRAQTEAAMHAATNEGVTRLITALEHLSERMSAYQPPDGENPAQGIFRDTVIGNIISVAEALPNLNISNDPRVDQAAKDVLERFRTMEPEVLRNSHNARNKAKADAQVIVDRLKGIF